MLFGMLLSMSKPHTFWLFTNRHIAVFDRDGNQLGDAQDTVSCYHIDSEAVSRVLDQAEVFEIVKWREWKQPVTKKDIQYLLGLRTREMDLQELDEAPERRTP